jgi:hypothetical protein
MRRRSLLIAASLLAGTAAGCSGAKSTTAPAVLGGEGSQRVLVQHILNGFGDTKVTQVRIAPVARPWKDHHQPNAVMLRFHTSDRSLLGQWEAEMVAGIFRDGSVQEGLPDLAAYVYPGGGEGFGESYDEHLSPKRSTSAAAQALRSRFRTAANRAGAKVLALRTVNPYGLALEGVLEVHRPAEFLRDELNGILVSLARGAGGREGEFIQVVGPKGERIMDWGGWTRMSGSLSWVRPDLRACAPLLRTGPVLRGVRRSCPTTEPVYEVVAPVLYRPGFQEPLACAAELASYPPAGCSGVRVTGYDFAHVPGVVRYGSGRMGWQTPVLRLAGVWDGHALHATRVSRAGSSAQTQPEPPARCDGSRVGRHAHALAHAIPRVARRIKLMDLQPCPRTVWLLVGVADPKTVAFIHRRFGDAVRVSGWLQRPATASRS